MKNKTNKIVSPLELLFFSGVLILFSLTASAEASDSRKVFEDKFKASFKSNTFTNFEPAPIAGLFQAEINNQVVYFAPEEELILFGEIYDKNGISISAQTRDKWQSQRISKLDFSNAITIGTNSATIEIIEFTDTDCPFCQKFDHYMEANYKDSSITRKVIMSPILQLHPNAAKEAIHLLCQDPKDYKKVLSQLLNGEIAYADMISCEKGKQLLEKHQELTQKFGVNATPTLILDGKVIQGFDKERIDDILQNKLK
jgi:thiol:disulfide interchange protein DsbC